MARKLQTFGQRLAKIREAAGLTREQVGELTGISRQYLWRLENDQQDPRWSYICRLADALKVATDAFR